MSLGQFKLARVSSSKADNIDKVKEDDESGHWGVILTNDGTLLLLETSLEPQNGITRQEIELLHETKAFSDPSSLFC